MKAIDTELNEKKKRLLEIYAPLIKADLRASVPRGTGKLKRGFREKLHVDTFGDIDGLEFTTKRYGFILHHGVKAQIINDPSNNRSYHTSGIVALNYVSMVMDKYVPEISKGFGRINVDVLVRQLKY